MISHDMMCHDAISSTSVAEPVSFRSDQDPGEKQAFIIFFYASKQLLSSYNNFPP